LIAAAERSVADGSNWYSRCTADVGEAIEGQQMVGNTLTVTAFRTSDAVHLDRNGSSVRSKVGIRPH